MTTSGMIRAAKAPDFAAVALLLALAAQVGAFILVSSNTNDELPVIGAGYAYVKTGRIELETKVHPPLMKYLFGLSLLAAAPDFHADSPALHGNYPYMFGYDFLYRNSVKPEVILAWARLPSLLLSLALAACLCVWARSWFGPWGGALALAVYVFEPNILAHSGIAYMDLGLTAFLFAAYFALLRYLEEPSPGLLALAGVLAGCAVSAKLPGIFFFVWSAGLALLIRRRFVPALRTNLALFAAAALVLAGLYQVRYLSQYLGILAQMAPRIFVPGQPAERHFNFLLGATKQGGWPYYYLVALAVKTTLPFLLLSALGFWKGLNKKERQIVGLPVASYLVICSLASKQMGIRYILPIFPFLCLAAAGLARLKSRGWRVAAWSLALWAAAETLAVAPNYLAYFNELAGGPSGGYRVLVDSNLDWGQDLPRLGALRRENGNPEIITAVQGDGDLDYYLGPHQDLFSGWTTAVVPDLYAHANSTAPAREWLIVGASALQGFGMRDPDAFAWLRGRPPLAQPGGGAFVYDVTYDPTSHFNVGLIYRRDGRAALAAREFERSAALAATEPMPALLAGDERRALGDERSALIDYAAALARARGRAAEFRELLPVLRARLRGTQRQRIVRS